MELQASDVPGGCLQKPEREKGVKTEVKSALLVKD